MPAVYVASPCGFAAPTRLWYAQVLLPRLERAGFEILDPWAGFDPVAPPPPDPQELYARIGARNSEMIAASDGLLAVLDGVDVDSGTAAEIGFAAAAGKPVVGYRSDLRETGEAGAAVNLQVEYFVRASGGRITRDLEEALKLLAGLTGLP